MLDFAPHAVAGDEMVLDTVAHACIGLPDTDRLLRLIAETRRAPVRRMRYMFEPERLSGFCAAG
jgi:hypothetical protein